MSTDEQWFDRRKALGLFGAGSAAAAGALLPGSPAAAQAQASPPPSGVGRETRSFESFGARADGAMAPRQLLAAITEAWQSALRFGHDLHHPGGVYDIGDAHFPWRQTGAIDALLDCRDIVISGCGPSSVFKTTSVGGADVFQLRGLRNLHFRDLRLMADLLGRAGSGSNAVSITGGFDNITLMDIWCDQLPSVDKSDFVDGGKALTIQCLPQTRDLGRLVARLFAYGCAQGFGADIDPVSFAGKKMAVDVELFAEACFTAVAIGGEPASRPVPPGAYSGLRIRAQAIDCQKDVLLGRVHGIDVDCHVISSKSAAARRLAPSGKPWQAQEATVEALVCTYAKNARLRVVGDKGECDRKALIGSADPGHSGRGSATSSCDIFLDIGGTAPRGGVVVADDHGPPLRDTVLVVTPETGSVPKSFYVPGVANLIVQGSRARLYDPIIVGSMRFAGSDGNETAELGGLDGALALRQRASSEAGQLVFAIQNDKGRIVAGIRNDGASLAGATIPAVGMIGDVVSVKPEYDEHNKLIGYSPIYRSFRPV
ncbi:hypothetical protein HZY97_00425 [Sphingomonas sp. R-74633]|uniref:hypothetical protein n=1 Tax=Sphingomonas sp. R-74633 TaxID=2751188 RepID=UPI0015D351DF|nr:hypothetical protein [Sphingomonas sp. R-74633]NYT39208.1 hypothetical protein [Sphingomonas sp. R-74633]